MRDVLRHGARLIVSEIFHGAFPAIGINSPGASLPKEGCCRALSWRRKKRWLVRSRAVIASAAAISGLTTAAVDQATIAMAVTVSTITAPMILLISEISVHRTKFGARDADRSGEQVSPGTIDRGISGCFAFRAIVRNREWPAYPSLEGCGTVAPRHSPRTPDRRRSRERNAD
jgi:hypothetical protein